MINSRADDSKSCICFSVLSFSKIQQLVFVMILYHYLARKITDNFYQAGAYLE